MILELHFKIISRKKYEGTKITFKSIADLRKETGKNIPKTLSTLHLIKSFIETNLNNNGKKQVRHHIFNYGYILFERINFKYTLRFNLHDNSRILIHRF